MYVVIVYDIGVERVNKVRTLLKEFLMWRQNSVFEGELTNSEYEKIKIGLKEIMDPKEDNIIIYKFRDKKYIHVDEFGTSKSDLNNII